MGGKTPVFTEGAALRFRFKNKKLEVLYTDEKGAHKYPEAVIDGFFAVMDRIAAATDERDLYALKSRRFEKLTGDRQGQHSMRLNDQWRLILVIEEDQQGRYLQIVEILDYH